MLSAPASDPVREATFGSGGSEPYAHALRRRGRLTLVGSRRGGDYDLDRWMAEADDVDLSLLAVETGPLLDVGCGPARMVQAAMQVGLVALGVDVSREVVSLAREAGLPVLRRSVFDRLPREGAWGSVLLVDGNIGIGGDPTALLERCRELLALGGSVIVEVQTDDDADDVFTAHVVDDHGRASETFPWAEIGSVALAAHAGAAGFSVERTWRQGGRAFCRLVARR